MLENPPREALPVLFDPGPLGDDRVVHESLKNPLSTISPPLGRHALSVKGRAGQAFGPRAVVDERQQLGGDLLFELGPQEARALEDPLAVDGLEDAAEHGVGDVGVEDDGRLLGLDRPGVEQLIGLAGGRGGDLLGRLEVGPETALAVLASRRLLVALLGHDRDADVAGRRLVALGEAIGVGQKDLALPFPVARRPRSW